MQSAPSATHVGVTHASSHASSQPPSQPPLSTEQTATLSIPVQSYSGSSSASTSTSNGSVISDDDTDSDSDSSSSDSTIDGTSHPGKTKTVSPRATSSKSPRQTTIGKPFFRKGFSARKLHADRSISPVSHSAGVESSSFDADSSDRLAPLALAFVSASDIEQKHQKEIEKDKKAPVLLATPTPDSPLSTGFNQQDELSIRDFLLEAKNFPSKSNV